MSVHWEQRGTTFRFLKRGNMVPLGRALVFLFSLSGLQEMRAILWSPWMAYSLLASAWNRGAHRSSPFVSASVVAARPPGTFTLLGKGSCPLWGGGASEARGGWGSHVSAS